MNPLTFVLTALGLLSGELRGDSKFTAVLAKQLDYVKAKTYDIVYPQLKGRMLIPVSHDAPSGAETITYRQWDEIGIASILANYADDIPLVDALAEEFTQKVYPIAAAYMYSIQDLRRAAMSNTRLDQKRARAARNAIEWKIEDMAAVGDSSVSATGLANNPNISLVSPVTGTWISATAAQMIADMLHFESTIIAACKETFMPTTLGLDIASYQRFATKVVSSSGDTVRTALSDFLQAAQSVTEVVSWNKLATADAAGTGPRAVMYPKDPNVLTLEIPQEYEEFPPQAKNLAYKVNTHARCAGVIVEYPVACGYMDGL